MGRRASTLWRPRLRGWIVGSGIGLCLLAAIAPAAFAGVFHPRDRYDCYVYSAITGGETYLNSFQFLPGRRYAVGFHNKRRTGLSVQFGHGRYKVVGKKIISTSGYLTRQHLYLLMQKADLAVVKNNGQFEGAGCYDHGAKPTPPRKPPTGPGAFPVGAYTCYHTEQDVEGGYLTSAPSNMTFWSDGTYMGSIRTDGWQQHGTTIQFTGGSLWSDVNHAHDQGTWHPSGVSLPNATGPAASMQFTLVIRDTRVEGGVPPSVEFSSTDGSGGSSSLPMSFTYCKQ